MGASCLFWYTPWLILSYESSSWIRCISHFLFRPTSREFILCQSRAPSSPQSLRFDLVRGSVLSSFPIFSSRIKWSKNYIAGQDRGGSRKMNDDRMHALGQTWVTVQVVPPLWGDGSREPPVFLFTSWPHTINDESVFVKCLLILYCGHLEFDSVSTYLFSFIFSIVSYAIAVSNPNDEPFKPWRSLENQSGSSFKCSARVTRAWTVQSWQRPARLFRWDDLTYFWIAFPQGTCTLPNFLLERHGI